MKAELKGTLEGYVRHAEHYGGEEVFETALDEGLSLKDLASLALRLQNIDPRWGLSRGTQRLFALALSGSTPYTAKKIASIVGCTPASVRGWADEEQTDAEVGPELALRRASSERFRNLQGIVRK